MDIKKGIQVLLVDDEDGFRQTLAKRLGRKGLLISQAQTGEKALALLEQSPVDVVVLDIKMPGMGGLEALAHIKRKYPAIEVILLTGHAAMDDGIYGIKNGAFDYLQKPVEHENLLNKISQASEKKQREKERAEETEQRASMEKQMVSAERLASLGTLAAGVAHEINNPLAIIAESAGFMRLLMEKDELVNMPHLDSFANAIGKIEKSVGRAKKTTMQLLGFASEPDTVLREIDIGELLEEVALLVSGQATDKGVVIEKEEICEKILLWTDPQGLRQVLVNLVSNGVAACEPGGRVILGSVAVNEHVEIWVRDTGKGIPRENLEKIFEPFFTTKPPGEGTGLGLFVSLDIMDRLGGKIKVKSKVGSGTGFTVRIPRLYKPGQKKDRDTNWLDKAREFERRNNHG